MVKTLGVETEFDVAAPRGGGGGVGARGVSPASPISSALSNLGKDIGTLATRLSVIAKDKALGKAIADIAESASTKANQVEAEIERRKGLRLIARKFGAQSYFSALEAIKNPKVTFQSGNNTFVKDLISGTTTRVGEATATPGPTTLEEVVMEETQNLSPGYETNAPRASALFSNILSRAEATDNLGKISAHDLREIPAAYQHFTVTNDNANQLSSAVLVDTNREVQANFTKSRFDRAANKVINAMDEVIFSIAESESLMTAVRDGTMSVREVKDIFDATKADMLEDLTDEGTLSNLGINRRALIQDLNSQISTAIEGFEAGRDGDLNATLRLRDMLIYKKAIENHTIWDNFSPDVKQQLITAPLLAQQVAIGKAVQGAIGKRKTGTAGLEDYNLLALVYTHATDVAQNKADLEDIKAAADYISSGKVGDFTLNVTRMTKMVQNTPMLEKDVQAVKLIYWAVAKKLLRDVHENDKPKIMQSLKRLDQEILKAQDRMKNDYGHLVKTGDATLDALRQESIRMQATLKFMLSRK